MTILSIFFEAGILIDFSELTGCSMIFFSSFVFFSDSLGEEVAGRAAAAAAQVRRRGAQEVSSFESENAFLKTPGATTRRFQAENAGSGARKRFRKRFGAIDLGQKPVFKSIWGDFAQIAPI